MPGRMAKVVLCTCLAGVLAGCEGQRAARVGPAAGGSWEAVLPGARVAELAADRGPAGWAATRNDQHLNLRPAEPVLASAQWPEPNRPSLRRPVFVRVLRQPEGFIYYRTEERYEYRRGW